MTTDFEHFYNQDMAALQVADPRYYPSWRQAMTLQLSRFWVPDAFRPDRLPPASGRWWVSDDDLRHRSRTYAETMVEAISALEVGATHYSAKWR